MGDTWNWRIPGSREMVEVCNICEGSGLRIMLEDGRQVARPCDCRIARRTGRMLERAHIPKRYENCTLESYECLRGIDKSLKAGTSFWNQETKARILHWQGHTTEAATWLEKAIQTARTLPADRQPPKEWFTDKERELAAWKSGAKNA